MLEVLLAGCFKKTPHIETINIFVQMYFNAKNKDCRKSADPLGSQKPNEPVGLFQSFIGFSIRLSMFHNRYDFRSNQRCQVVGLVNLLYARVDQ